MHVSVLIEPVAGLGFRATGGEPFAITAEGPTRDEALDRLRSLIAERLAGGAELVTLDVARQDRPWDRFVGTLPDDELTREWLEEMAIRRRDEDATEKNMATRT